ncbi:MAG: ShlB/FhaC/HecB family hemolysin secretion/activation protein [Alcanivorax nanhaiticus]
MSRPHYWSCSALCGLFLCNVVAASPFPNSGSLFREYKDDSFGKSLKRESTDTELEVTAPPSSEETGKENDARITVNGYEIHGNQTLDKTQLHGALEPYTGRELSLNEIHTAAATLRQAYVDQGYFATQVIIPPQAIHDGVVLFYVYEGTLATDGLLTRNSGDRVSDETLHSFIQNHLEPGMPIKKQVMERTLLLIDDLPGIDSRASLYPGSLDGTANLLVDTEDRPLISGNLDIDNYGSYYTGETRVGATLNVNSPRKVGDLLTVRVMSSGTDSNYGFVQYEQPVGGNGFQLGGSADYFDYTLGKEFKDLNAEGNASEFRLFGRFPFIRSRQNNLVGSLELIHSRFDDRNDALGDAKRHINGIALGLRGEHTHNLIRGGDTFYSLTITGGELVVDGDDGFETLDSLTSDTQGGFIKARASLSRLQHLHGPLSLFASIEGQATNSNLDSAEKFYIAGPYGVSGYPFSEAGGDEGMLLHADLRYDFLDLFETSNVQLSAFYTQGWTHIHHNTWDGWQTNSLIENRVELASAGVAWHQTWQDTVLFRAVSGWQLGSNVTRDPVTDRASDNSDADYRIWLQAIYYF